MGPYCQFSEDNFQSYHQHVFFFRDLLGTSTTTSITKSHPFLASLVFKRWPILGQYPQLLRVLTRATFMNTKMFPLHEVDIPFPKYLPQFYLCLTVRSSAIFFLHMIPLSPGLSCPQSTCKICPYSMNHPSSTINYS